jgi:penicillin-binding protein 1A
MVSPVKPLVALWRKPVARRSMLVGMLGIGGFGVGVAWGSWTRACAGQVCPSIAEFDEYRPVQSVKFYAADGRLITDAGESRTLLRLDEISLAMPAAMLAIEDKRFFEHNGIDYVRCFGAGVKFVLSMSLGGGGCSSITMQLARNVFPNRLPRNRRSLLTTVRRKVRELQVALELERTYSKERLIELYLNQIFWGGRAHGVETASQQYFGKSAADLNVAEAATLAAMIQLPNAYNPRRYPRKLLLRRNVVLNLMRDQGYITAEETEKWKAYPVMVNTSRDEYRGVAEYFVEWVRTQLYARFGNRLYTDGYLVYTTLDLDMQLAAERALEDQLQVIESGKLRPDLPQRTYPHASYQDYLDSLDGEPPKITNTPYLQGAMIALDTLGYVQAMVGGRSFAESEYNRATQAARQPGSTFKPFVYSAAIRAGRSPSYIVEDRPISIMQNDSMPWEPQNFEFDFRGPMTLRQGLRQSRNLVAIRLGQELGTSTVVGEALQYGLSTRIPSVPSSFIGSASVLLVEMASAYTAFATLGTRAAPIGILRVEDAAGNIVWEPTVARTTIMERERMWLLSSMLREVVDAGTGYNAVRRFGEIPYSIPVGGKTGTTNDGTDVWFMGFTPELVAGVWIGFDQPTKIMANSAGGLLAAPAWATFMKDVYSRRPAPSPWERPESLIPREVDKFTGYRATDWCPPAEVYVEWFIPGTEPTERCPIHQPNYGITSILPLAPSTRGNR